MDHNPCSDHFPILLSLTTYTLFPNPPRGCYNKANWHTFASISNLSKPPPEFSSTYEMLTYLLTFIFNAAAAAIRKRTRSISCKCVPWWNPSCTKALRQTRAAWSSYRNKHNTPGQLQLSSFSKRQQPILNVPQKWPEQKVGMNVSSITSNTPLTSVWRPIHKLSGKCSLSNAHIRHINNNVIADPEQVVTELGSFFSHVSSGFHLSTIKTTMECTTIPFSLSSTE